MKTKIKKLINKYKYKLFKKITIKTKIIATYYVVNLTKKRTEKRTEKTREKNINKREVNSTEEKKEEKKNKIIKHEIKKTQKKINKFGISLMLIGVFIPIIASIPIIIVLWYSLVSILAYIIKKLTKKSHVIH